LPTCPRTPGSRGAASAVGIGDEARAECRRRTAALKPILGKTKGGLLNGGFEIGVLAGVFLGAAAGHRPVIVDGFISGAAALIAYAIASEAGHRFIASHQSVEPGHRISLSHMGLEPLLDMGMRLGEGSGAALSMHIVEAAAKCLSDMATFAEAGVSEKIEDDGEEAAS